MLERQGAMQHSDGGGGKALGLSSGRERRGLSSWRYSVGPILCTSLLGGKLEADRALCCRGKLEMVGKKSKCVAQRSLDVRLLIGTQEGQSWCKL